MTGATAPEPQTVEEDTLRDDEFPTGRRGTEGEVASEEQPVVVPDPRSEVVPGPDAGTPIDSDATDEDTADEVLAMARDLVTRAGCGFLMVTHSARLAATLERQVTLHAGLIA